jgi:nickel/cobalt transporter (NicO) family protein
VRWALRSLAVLGVASAALAGGAGPAAAHPLGNFTINVAAVITVAPGEVRVRYAVDMAEIPTFQELRRIDVDADGDASSEELEAWGEATGARIASQLDVRADGGGVGLTQAAATAELRPGQGGLQTLRLDVELTGSIPRHGSISVEDGTYPDRVGWREISAVGADGLAVTRSSVPTSSRSRMLSSYPDDLLSSPLEVRSATFSYGPGEQASTGGSRSSAGARPDTGGPLADLVARPNLTLGVVLVSLLAAAGIGAVHGLAPGHGKTVTAAYMIGAGGRIRQAVGAGLAVAVMHTGSVLVLGLVVALAERAFPAERVYPVLTAVAGATAVALGIGLLIRRFRARHHHHDHRHRDHAPLSRRGLAALAVSGGLLPSPSAVLVLVAAMALSRAAFGIALVGAFGLGLAASLASVAIVAVRLNDAASRRLPSRAAAALPFAGAGAIVVAGSIVAWGGLAGL